MTHEPSEVVPERTLVVLSYSPWSERARWVLEHHGLPYRKQHHAPFLGERKLRRIVGPGVPRPTVPILLAGEEKLTDSWDIALYADREGSGERLIPDDLANEIRRCADRAERAMVEGRALVVAGLLKDGDALDETLPPGIPGFVRPLLRPLTRFGTAWFGRKYALDLEALSSAREALAGALASFRERLGDKPYLLDRFTYADIVLCSLLQGIEPVADHYLRLGPAQRRVWTQPELAREYQDLIAWRNRTYAAKRRR
ncbi:MAG TPA: glutathione S-transferase [Polyangiaceae bacterium]